MTLSTMACVHGTIALEPFLEFLTFVCVEGLNFSMKKSRSVITLLMFKLWNKFKMADFEKRVKIW